ncbi:MAG: hypothetical protein H6839_01745 [Planctomycetes bacterium]|nr:hypothetical protein [Planctomycetota bacterium]
MSLEAQYRALYQLMYKRGTRDAFEQGKFERFEGTTDAESAEIGKVAGLRQNIVVQLHANDIGNNWYAPRFPATWMALQVALGVDQPELTMRLTDTDAFELRVNDDFDGRALAGYVQQLAEFKPPRGHKTEPPLAGAPWLPELLRYERMIAGHWPDDASPRVEKFDWDVGGVHDALLEKELFPVDEKPVPLHLLLHRDEAGVTEVALNAEQARTMKKLLGGEDTKDEPPKVVAKCRRVLNQLKS